MKKFCVLLFMFGLSMTITQMFAQNETTVHKSALSLGYLKNFNPDKMSVRSNFGLKHMISIESNAEYPIDSYDYIVSINGIPASGFQTTAEAEAATIRPGDDGRVMIEYYSMSNDSVFWISYIPTDIETIGLDESDLYRDGAISFSQARFNYSSGTHGMQILTDSDVRDWSKYRKVAFIPRSNDVLVEKEYAKKVLDELSKSGFPFIYDEENPDIVFTIAFDESMDVTSTYVPPTTQYIDNGSNTYVHQSKGKIYINSFKNPHTKVTTGGYTHKDIETRHFFEVTFLDAKKMEDPKQSVPPIVWQLRYKKEFERPKSLRSALRTVLAGCRAFPGKMCIQDPVYSWSGICWDNDKPVVRYVYKGSPAEKLGLQPGDEILKVDGKNKIKFKMQSMCDGRVVYENVIHELSIKNQSWYNMLKNSKLNVFAAYNDFQIPYVDVYWQDKYYDGYNIKCEPNVFLRDSKHIIEIKRNGKKMKLEGSMYGRIRMFDATLNLPVPTW